jgi:hypothetical protein
MRDLKDTDYVDPPSVMFCIVFLSTIAGIVGIVIGFLLGMNLR